MTHFLHSTKILFLMIIYLLFNKTSSEIITNTERKKICSESEEYINSFFTKDEELDEKYLKYNTNSDFLTNDKYIIQMLLLNQNAKKKYKEKKLSKHKFYNILNIVIFVISIIITFIFNGHFFYRLCGNKKIELESDKNISLLKFYKISPFAWIRYLLYGKEKKEEFYIQLKNQKFKINKCLKILLVLIIFCLLIVSMIYAVFNNKELDESENATNNISCAIMNFLYEIKNGTLRKNNFIGLEQINAFFNEFNSYNKNSDENLEKYNESFNNKTKKLIEEWENYITYLNSELKNNEFYINSYPSYLNYTEGDIEKCANCEKQTFQIKNINDYYPSNDMSKSLYMINQFFHDNIDSIYNLINKINDNFFSTQKTSTEINENLYQNILEISNNIIDIYIDLFTTEYLTNVHYYFMKDNFPFLFNIDFAYLIFLVMICVLFVPLLLYSYYKKNSGNKIFMIFLFFECLFCLLIISIASSFIIVNMKSKITYIDDLSKAVYFLIDEENTDYLETNSEDYEIENIKYNIKDQDGTEKSIFYFLNYIINNDGNVSKLFNMNFPNIHINEVNELSVQLNNIINNKENLMNKQLTNSYIENNANNFLKIINNGLDANIYFKNVNGNNIEYLSLYLSYVNSFTMFKNKEYLNIDELWNISTSSFDKYVYKNKNSANNHYYKKDDLSTPALLNYLEYELDEILVRYEDLLINKKEIYYGIINQFKSLEYFRKDNIVINQIQKIYEYNNYLNTLESNIFELIKQNVLLSKEITDTYINKFNKYSNDKNNIYSFLDCNFIKKDLYFVLGEINISFISTMQKFCKNHLLINIIIIFLSLILIIFYSLISYEIPLTKKRIYFDRKIISYPDNENRKEMEEIKYKKATEESEKEEKKQPQKRKKLSKKENSFEFLRGNAFMNSNIGGSVSIVHGGNTINTNNICPQMNAISLGQNGNPLNDILNINKLISPVQRSINNLFTNSNTNNGAPIINNEPDRRNNIDQSKTGMIEELKEDVVGKIKKKNQSQML